jgi:BA14K-like protein
MKIPCKLLAASVLSVGATFAVPAGAAPITAPSSLRNATAPPVETVQWRRDWRGWGPGAVAGAIVGGAIAAAQPWNWGHYDAYAYAPGYYGAYGYAPGYAYAPGYTYAPGEAYGDYAYAPGPGYSVGYSGGSDTAYCSQRFRSYDPGSGTYLGYDGMRHPCP